MNENDMKQLSSFMGHTLGIYRSSYTLPEDVYQTTKMSQLFLLMEKGEADQFNRKSLDKITVNLDEDLMLGKMSPLETEINEVQHYVLPKI